MGKVPKILPTSAIMSDIEATSVRFLRLCEKYINVGSEFEINISGKHRRNLINIYKLLEDKINTLNPKMHKLQSLFGNDSELTASRRASQTKYLQTDKTANVFDEFKRQLTQDDIGNHDTEDNGMSEEDVDNVVTRKTGKSESQGNKVSHVHSTVEDFQLLSNTDDVLTRMYDSLCYTLGDVHTNLNDGCSRFMQTDVYFRWYTNNFKKEKQLNEEEEPSQSSTEKRKRQSETMPKTGLNVMHPVASHTQTNDRVASDEEDVAPESPSSVGNETKPINQTQYRFSTAL